MIAKSADCAAIRVPSSAPINESVTSIRNAFSSARLYSAGGILRYAPWRSRTACARLKADALVSGASE